MANCVSPIGNPAACPPRASHVTTAAVPSPAAVAAPDRVALQSPSLTALLGVAATAAQLVPGVLEAEATTGAATAIGAGVRAVIANPIAKALLAAGAGAAGSYAKSLLHDATAGQPALHGLSDFARSLDTAVHSSLGIAQSDSR